MKIWFLVGQSNTGKDTVMSRVLNSCIWLNRFLYCTTRSMRENEENGREYLFKTNEEYKDDVINDRIVESRCYHLADKDVHYYTLKDIDRSKDYIVAGTINQCLSYLNYFGSDVVKPIRIVVSDYDRITRGIERERRNKEDYREVCRRFYDEFNEYTEENFEKLNFVLEVENKDLDECCKKLISYIIQEANSDNIKR